MPSDVCINVPLHAVLVRGATLLGLIEIKKMALRAIEYPHFSMNCPGEELWSTELDKWRTQSQGINKLINEIRKNQNFIQASKL